MSLALDGSQSASSASNWSVITRSRPSPQCTRSTSPSRTRNRSRPLAAGELVAVGVADRGHVEARERPEPVGAVAAVRAVAAAVGEDLVRAVAAALHVVALAARHEVAAAAAGHVVAEAAVQPLAAEAPAKPAAVDRRRPPANRSQPAPPRTVVAGSPCTRSPHACRVPRPAAHEVGAAPSALTCRRPPGARIAVALRRCRSARSSSRRRSIMAAIATDAATSESCRRRLRPSRNLLLRCAHWGILLGRWVPL